MLFPIGPQALDTVMEIVFPMIDDACAHSLGRYTGSDIVQFIRNSEMQLWAAVEDSSILGISITEVKIHPHAKTVRFLCATGENSAQWIPYIEEIEKWAKGIGCTASQAECRPGWEKLLKSYGYKKNHILCDKELS